MTLQPQFVDFCQETTGHERDQSYGECSSGKHDAGSRRETLPAIAALHLRRSQRMDMLREYKGEILGLQQISGRNKFIVPVTTQSV